MGKGSLLGRLGVVLALAVASACSQGHAAELSLREFQDRAVREIQRQHADAKVTRLGDHQLRIELPGDGGGTYNLDRGYGFYQGTPAELETIIRDIASSVGPHAGPTAGALLVLVRPAGIKLAAGEGGPSDGPLVKPLVGDLAAFVAVDRPDSYAITGGSRLRSELKMEDRAIWDVALKNTRAHLNFERRPLKLGEPTEISTGVGLASSLLVMDAFWDSPELTAAGPVVVAMFARDTLYLAPLSDTKTVQSLRKLMADVRDDPNGLTNDLIVRRNGRWEVLQ